MSTIAKDQTQINDKIRSKELRLIGQDGEQIGVKSKREALKWLNVRFRLSGRCTECETTSCKMDYGKFKFEQQKKKRNEKKQKLSMLKKFV